MAVNQRSRHPRWVASCHPGGADRGAGLVEYALLVGIFVLAIMGGLQYLERQGAQRTQESTQGLVVDGGTVGPVAGGGGGALHPGENPSSPGGDEPGHGSDDDTPAPEEPGTVAPLPSLYARDAQVKWSNGNRSQGGSWEATVDVANDYESQAQNGHMKVKITQIRDDGVRHTIEREFQTSSSNPIRIRIDNLNYRPTNGRDQMVNSIEVQVVSIRLNNQTTLLEGPVLKIDGPL